MSGLFNRPNGEQEPAIGDLKVQTSVYGMAIGVIFGRQRIPIQLLWYGDFRAISVEERQEVGKGGSPPSRVSYVYSASVVMSLGEGPIGNVRRIWKGKQRFDAVEAGFVRLQRTERATIPVSPYQVTVGGNAVWSDDLSVQLHGSVAQVDPGVDDWEVDRELRAGTDYTVTDGVYTFDSSLEGRTVSIRYGTTEATAAATAAQSLGLTHVVQGAKTAGTWAHLTDNHPSEALPYADLSYLYAKDYPLSDYARVENHLVEVDGRNQSSLGYPDCNHAEVYWDILTNPQTGIGFPSLMLEFPTAWADFIDAANLWISPAYLAQRPARDYLEDLFTTGFARPLWDGAKLRVIPIWDKAQASYTPNNTPVFDLGPDDLLPNGEGLLVEVERRGIAEADTRVRVEWTNRDNEYQTQVAEWRNEAAELDFGPKVAPTMSMDFICRGDVAKTVAQMTGHVGTSQGDRYGFRVSSAYMELQPGDLVTLTDPSQGLAGDVVMVESIKEVGEEFHCEGFAFPIGQANAPIVAPPLGSGFIPNMNEDPGDANAPVIFEPPGGYVTGGLEVWVATSGGSQWGGGDVYASLDGGESYKQIGTIDQHCRHGSVVSLSGSGDSAILTVQLANSTPKLRSVSAADAAAGRTLCYVGTATGGEWLTFQTATLIAPGRYELGGLTRGLRGTVEVAHQADDDFVFLDFATASSGPLDIGMIGKEVSIKIVSFNRYGGGIQSLADVQEYTHTVTGRFRDQKGVPFVANLLTNPGFEFDLADWDLSFTTSSFSTLVRAHIDPVNRIAGVPGNATISQESRLVGGGILAARLTSRPVKIDPSKELFLSAKLLPVNAKANIELLYAPASGDFDAVGGGVEVFFPDLYGTTDSGDPEDYVKIEKRIKPLATARYAALRIVKYDSTPDSASLLRIMEPFLGQGPRGLPEFPDWNSGTKSTTDTAAIASGAVEGTATFRRQSVLEVSGSEWVAALTLLKTYGLDDPPEQWIATVNIDATIQSGATQTLISVQANLGGQDATVVAANSIGNGNTARSSTSFTVDLGTKGVSKGVHTENLNVRIDGAADASATINSCSVVLRLKRR